MNRLEERIRDFLAINLRVIEPNLTIVRKEYRLANNFGSDGSIDILAKDSLGHYVIIEIKRSNQAARAALHELTKYVALLRSSLGVPAEKIRALLVSTEWKELAVPFSEYQKICEVPTAGYIISATDSGEVVRCNKFAPVHVEQGLSISRQQSLILYENATKRDSGINIIASAAIQSQLSDFAILTADYKGRNSDVIYPFGIYFGFSSPISNPESEESKRIMQALKWDECLDDLDENFLCAMMDKIRGNDTAEIGHPEKLKLMDEQGWSISVVFRNGRYQKNIELLSNDQLMSEFTKTEGGANYYLQHTSSPKYLPSWNKFKSDVFLVLMGNKKWESFFDVLTREIEADSSNSTVSISLYNPGNILLGLSKVFGENDFRYLPSFQLVISGERQTTIYLGNLAWNGIVENANANKWIENSYGTVEDYFLMLAFGEQYVKEDLACKGLGLQYAIYEIINPGKADESTCLITLKNGLAISRALLGEDLFTIKDFYSSHITLGKELVEIVRGCSLGFLGGSK
ncbi:endonuclease NucS domain-containing protein [Pseudomonas sp. GL-RE-26]|uniref:endonuclease NucS domain-containing protein n=1 Tax=Pseudomonas sp. GL-RE-26 TaxID=2832390 RepID=UPI001CBF4F2B|nr:endonuclease NucS domain-containing protein [Pseudomonas sp. GL-RE-26]